MVSEGFGVFSKPLDGWMSASSGPVVEAGVCRLPHRPARVPGGCGTAAEGGGVPVWWQSILKNNCSPLPEQWEKGYKGCLWLTNGDDLHIGCPRDRMRLPCSLLPLSSLTVITAWYAFVTRRIMKATAQQATAALQPVLTLSRLVDTLDESVPRVLIHNAGDRPVVFLDVVIGCHSSGHRSIVDKLRGWDDQILGPNENTELRLDFSKPLAEIGATQNECGFWLEIVVSDLGRQVVIQYDYVWVLGRFTCKIGLPWRVRWRYIARPWGWRYNRLKRRFSGKKSLV
jgi:hypothetical protein